MIRFLLHRLTNRLPARIISDGDTPYLERYYVGTFLGVRFYLHQFVGSDPDRGLHDHPWPWAFSIILAGSYLEETRSGKKEVRWFNTLVGDSFHRVVLKERYGRTLPVWTLFAHRAKRVKRWGFMRATSSSDEFYYFLHRPSVDECWWETAPKGAEIRGAQ
ncbi:hypothetical protein RE432_15055 [Pusillimonas sp. SM2304]|uniref:hypothetical protein n=1 Tax=Pusillimonas sp. SM2304 TaxID=3073241 RepID=UPI002876ABF2|nr:hypothetical protein [Pusillimonas sp. SM2304]MDS1141758.1 hypothetical protein [Pusillimonas sp. SM2304]